MWSSVHRPACLAADSWVTARRCWCIYLPPPPPSSGDVHPPAGACTAARLHAAQSQFSPWLAACRPPSPVCPSRIAGLHHSRNHCRPPCLQVATKSTFFQQPDFYGVDLTALHAPATAGYFGQARLLQRPLCHLVSRGVAHAMARACLLPCVTCAIAAGRLGKRVVMLPVCCHKQQAWKAHQTSTQLPAWNWQSAASTDPVPHIMPSLGMDAWPHIMLSTPAFSELAFVVCSSLQVVVDQIPPNVLVSNCVSKTFDFLAITEQVRSPSQTLSCRLHTRQRTARHPAHCCPFAVCPAWKGESLS